jgi:hypothetical protein
LEEHVCLARTDEPAGSIPIALEQFRVGNLYFGVAIIAPGNIERTEGMRKGGCHFDTKVRGVRHRDILVHLLPSNPSSPLQTAIPNAGKNPFPKMLSFFSCFFFEY